tara:strand:+ start:245 stop:664 length:420 start_codon:yes stop_codon:yes gene_type:complete
MKGETHLASLVLESYGGTSRRFDLQLVLPFIAGIGQNFDKLKATQQVQMRNLYVAMSRPTDFLCLAANESRIEAQTIAALLAKGWEIDYALTGLAGPYHGGEATIKGDHRPHASATDVAATRGDIFRSRTHPKKHPRLN